MPPVWKTAPSSTLEAYSSLLTCLFKGRGVLLHTTLYPYQLSTNGLYLKVSILIAWDRRLTCYKTYSWSIINFLPIISHLTCSNLGSGHGSVAKHVFCTQKDPGSVPAVSSKKDWEVGDGNDLSTWDSGDPEPVTVNNAAFDGPVVWFCIR